MDKEYVLERTQGSRKGKRYPDYRERMLRDGSKSLADRELLAALLGSGCHGRSIDVLARDVLAVIDKGKPDLELDVFRELDGMGTAKACSVAAALELGRRFFAMKEKRIVMPRDLFPLINHYADRRQEHFLCVSLNGAHEIICVRQVSSGLVNKTVVHPREVFADPLTDRACAIIVAHNHPSGNIEPSKEDIDITKRLRDVGEILGVPLLDHLVFSDSAYYSFVEHGLITPFSGE
ncbi:MAG: DNA repair protein RadC [Spirochaetes bacterium]|nr:DNA repair protein RadC [Spirochaetota bacterium]